MSLLAKSAPLVAVIGCYKYAKYRLLCWRLSSVNSEVCKQIEERLEASGAPLDLASKCLPCAQQRTCAICSLPTWVRQNAEDRLVLLGSCGCVLHSQCLLEEATRQHGFAVFNLMDKGMDEILILARRLFNIDAVGVDSFRCPRCNQPAPDLQRVAEVESHATTVPEAISKGAPVGCKALRAAVLTLEVKPGVLGVIRTWHKAAKSEESFREALKLKSSKALQELATVFSGKEGPATISCWWSPPEPKDRDDQELDPRIPGIKSTVGLSKDRVIRSLPVDPTPVNSAQLKTYSEFL